MAISIKTEEEIALMRKAGEVLSKTLDELAKEMKPGMSTYEVDKIGEEIIRSYGLIPSFKNYEGFPGAVCVSMNDEVVHGIPNKKHILRNGDIVGIDCGVIYKGYHSDAARTVAIGEISDEAADLIKVTRESFYEGIKMAKPGNRIGDIGRAVESYVKSHGYTVVRDLMGHGIGSHLHESPDIPNFKTFRRGPKIEAGMTFAVEPMVNQGSADIWWMEDEWTVVTADGKLSAHYENTILVTEGEPEILSQVDDK